MTSGIRTQNQNTLYPLPVHFIQQKLATCVCKLFENLQKVCGKIGNTFCQLVANFVQFNDIISLIFGFGTQREISLSTPKKGSVPVLGI